MAVHIVYFLLGVVSSYRLSRLFIDDTITGFIRRPLYEEIDGELTFHTTSVVKHMLGKLFTCYWCMGFWTSLIMLNVYLLNAEYFIYTSMVLTSSTLVAMISELVKRVEQ